MQENVKPKVPEFGVGGRIWTPQFVRYLERHGRATNYEVGEALGLSASAASRRIQTLEIAGAIRGYRAVSR